MRADTFTRPMLFLVPPPDAKPIVIPCGRCDAEFTGYREGVVLRQWAAHRISAHRELTEGSAA
jgi:hypothetical protein